MEQRFPGLDAGLARIHRSGFKPTRLPDGYHSNYQQFGPNSGDVYLMGDTTHSLIANVTKIIGRHSLKTGVDVRINFVNYGQLGTPPGGFNFTRAMRQGPDPRAATSIGGDGYASFLLGVGGDGSAGSGGSITHQIRPANANHYEAFFIRDDFKVNHKLTLNAGFAGTSKAARQSGTTSSAPSTRTSRTPSRARSALM